MDLSIFEGVVFCEHRHDYRAAKRDWREREKRARLAPLSTKVKHRGARVEVVPQPKKRGGK